MAFTWWLGRRLGFSEGLALSSRWLVRFNARLSHMRSKGLAIDHDVGPVDVAGAGAGAIDLSGGLEAMQCLLPGGSVDCPTVADDGPADPRS